ncbi:MAG: polysaccharide biosynthesis tyrosine autokinase [Tetrasphaera sp.]|nr:polysaccharide biosynthesis tyrosine autokinase [Tetrasphaera sp.]
MDLRDYIRILRTHYRVVLAIIAASLVAAWLVTAFSPRVYTATASGLVKAPSGTSTAEDSIGDALAKSRVVSYVVLATGRPTAQRVINELGFNTTPDALIHRVHVTQPTNTVTIRVSASANTPTSASQLADAWVKALAAEISAVEDPTKTGKTIHLVPVESAAIPTRPSSPNPTRNLAVGGALGALAGFAYALLRARIDRRIRDIDTVTRDFGVTVAGAIPLNEALERKPGQPVPIVVAGPRDAKRSNAAESFFKIRTNLQFMDIDNPPRVIVVTSPMPGDGKSTVAANLAAALAASGEPVILLDGDLRRPVVAESFGLPEGAGLTNLLTAKATVEEVAERPIEGLPLHVVTAGSIPPNPSELLGSKTMRQLLQSLRKDYLVVIDAPPLLPVTDAAVLTANADGALIVISAGKTLDAQLDGAIAHLEQVSGHILGVIFNKVQIAAGGYGYGNYGYYGGYGYYGEDSKPTKKAGQRKKAPPKQDWDQPISAPVRH